MFQSQDTLKYNYSPYCGILLLRLQALYTLCLFTATHIIVYHRSCTSSFYMLYWERYIRTFNVKIVHAMQREFISIPAFYFLSLQLQLHHCIYGVCGLSKRAKFFEGLVCTAHAELRSHKRLNLLRDRTTRLEASIGWSPRFTTESMPY